MLTTALLLLLLAQSSQPPAPSAGPQSQAPQGQSRGQRQGAKVSPPPSPQTVASAQQPVATTPTQEPTGDTYNQYYSAPTEGWDLPSAINAIATVVMAVLTAVLAVVAWQQRMISDRQRKIMDQQRQLMANQLTANEVVQRAYVTMSHNKPGIVQLDKDRDPETKAVISIDVSITVRICNFGNTPATVTRAVLQLVISNQPLAITPEYDESKATVISANLVKTDTFDVFQNFEFQAEDVGRINTGADGLKLYVVGYVDYIDKFGRRHRSGYARVYQPEADARDRYRWRGKFGLASPPIFDIKRFSKRNNLSFVLQPGYNYDRERKEPEGNDWDNPSTAR